LAVSAEAALAAAAQAEAGNPFRILQLPVDELISRRAGWGLWFPADFAKNAKRTGHGVFVAG
jgi:hypothetical protein